MKQIELVPALLIAGSILIPAGALVLGIITLTAAAVVQYFIERG